MRERDSRLEPSDALIAEVAEVHLVAIKAKRQDKGGVFPVEEMKLLRQHADDQAPLAVDDERSADDGRVAAKLAPPISVRQHGRFGRARGIVLLCESAPQSGLHAEKRERAVGHQKSGDLLGFGHSCDAHGIARVQANILNGSPLLAKDEVIRG